MQGVGLIEHGVIKALGYRDIRRQKFKKMSRVAGVYLPQTSTLESEDKRNLRTHIHTKQPQTRHRTEKRVQKS